MRHHHIAIRLVIMLVVGVIAAIVTGAFGEWVYAPTVGWCFASLVYSAWVWISIGRENPEQTAAHASREEPARGVADLMVLLLSIASLFSVGFVLVNAAHAPGAQKGILAGLALVSVALSWILLHTLFTLRYARLYYTAEKGIDFNQPDPPQYTDFAYLSFTLGMTFQVSDTNITSHRIRVTALRHALLSFVFGSVILASTVNLIAGLSS
ncbi:DUF1345 domain-containing protein [Glaciihabitans sp. UYNi722]|uniref:DUF1345 domain-containing protein n=1 Tax=Glaciihabitans sp. UYNi722 TaxID=3156344 RepID=UPI00339628EC